jgi:hypothetical protein
MLDYFRGPGVGVGMYRIDLHPTTTGGDNYRGRRHAGRILPGHGSPAARRQGRP